jgi:hypothetical protein
MTMSDAWKARVDRYLAINAWLKKRYSGKGVGRFPGKPGWLITNAGGEPTRYSVLDLAFFKRYALD